MVAHVALRSVHTGKKEAFQRKSGGSKDPESALTLNVGVDPAYDAMECLLNKAFSIKNALRGKVFHE